MKSNKTDNNKKVCFINGRGYKMAGLKKLPIGIENFEKLRQEDFYYIDKTRLIEQLLTRWGASKPVYPSETLWKIPEYEYAPEVFLRLEKIRLCLMG